MIAICANPACHNPFKARPKRRQQGQDQYCCKPCYWACFVPQTLEERFWSKVDTTSSPDGCWLWTGHIHSTTGYGLFSMPHTKPGTFKQVLAHRVGYILQYGPIPPGLWVLHKPPCVNRLCVRHLYVGTPQDNSNDTVLLGRTPKGTQHGLIKHPERRARGERQGNAKLTDQEVAAIRAAWTGTYGEQAAFAKQYHVSPNQIWGILHNKTRMPLSETHS